MSEEISNVIGPEGKIPRKLLPGSLHTGLAVAVCLACLWGGMKAWSVGASRLLTHHGRRARLLVQTDRAVNKTPDDPEAHSARAFVLLNMGNINAALPEYERAVALRPHDYFLWLELGRARDLNNDETGAIAALEQAVRLAPVYAEPRWQLGNVLFRAGRVEEAFGELRRAALSNPALLPNLIDLAWGSSGGDPSSVEQILRPENASWRIALARYFVKRGRTSEALAQFRLAGGISEEDRQALLKELMSARRYKEAYEIWLEDSGNSRPESGSELIIDGGFESKMSRTNSGFGWQLTSDTEDLRLSLDLNNPHKGEHSLRVDFNGESNPNQSIITQLIPVEPNARYRLSFAVRTDEIVTGGLPSIVVTDASQQEGPLLAQSPAFQQDSGQWKQYSVDLTTSQSTNAVLISLHRQSCSGGPCPIFGRLWLDGFSFERISAD